MTWQMTLAACAAANLKPGLPPDPDPYADADVEWNAAQKPTDCNLTNVNKTVESVGANNLLHLQAAAKAIKPGDGIVYFEIYVDAVGAASNVHGVGLLGEVASQVSNGSNSLAAQRNSGFGYFHNGSLYVSGWSTTASLTGLGNLAAGTTIGIAYDAANGECWVWRNGTIINSGDWATRRPSLVLYPGHAAYPAVNPRDNGDRFILRSLPADFAYTLPDGAVPYGSDNTNFTFMYLVQRNDQLCAQLLDTGGTATLGDWSIDAAGSTFGRTYSNTGRPAYTPAPSRGYHAQFANNGTPDPVQNVFPNQSGKTYGELYQDHVVDARIETLVDNGEYALRMSCKAFYDGTDGNMANYGCSFNVSFFDATDTLIDSEESPKFGYDRGGYSPYERFINVPPLTRKIRCGYRQYKTSAHTSDSTAGAGVMAHRQAALIRTTNLLRVLRASSPKIVMGYQQDSLYVSRARCHIVLTP